mmetsp:Transcript_15160/g.28249  ORF Transcript_15160/g.28249 Transcript_15160/m.28249 type:complete len:151 (-) Transcript_15160:72-524(-)
MMRPVLVTVISLLVLGCSDSFLVPIRTAQHSITRLKLGIPKFLIPNADEDDPASKGSLKGNANGGKNKGGEVEKPKMDMKGLIQLITAGAGSPFLGDYKGVDKETGNFMFELEANNLVDENGESKQTKAKYFEEGWVDEDDEGFKWPWQK